jgi:undecaprenyl-diphosphatase
MTTFQAIILGLIQGVTEFLPISSTAHLRVVPALLGWDDPGAAFTAVTQLGTLAATFVFFWKDIRGLASGMIEGLRSGQPFTHPHSRLALGIVVGSIPIGVLGLVFKKAIEKDLRSLYVVASALILVAIVMAIAELIAKHQRDLTQMTFVDAVIVGSGQAAALIPGASRSGSTLATGLFLGLKRDTAARFSFLLSIPAVAAAGLLELKSVIKAKEFTADSFQPLAIATIVAFLSGLAVIAFLLRFLATRSTAVFIVYRIVLGVSLLVMLSCGVLAPNAGVQEKKAAAETVR